jgi:hypothetical protein
LIEHVNIIDLDSGDIIAHQDVLITGNKIIHIAKHVANNTVASTTIDGRDKYLLPGLWDMHAHMMRYTWYQSQMPLMRANGITGFREMWGDLNVVERVKTKMLRDSLPHFRFVAPGHILDGGKPFWENSLSAASQEEATAKVDSLVNAGAHFVKIYSFVKPDVFRAIAKRCRELSIPFAGHVPHVVRLTDASDAGMASMEHLYGFLSEASAHSDEAMALMAQSVSAFENGNAEERRSLSRRYHSSVLQNFSRQRMIDACTVLKRNNTHIVPTLSLLKGIYFINDTTFTNDSRKRYLSDETLAYWREVEEADLKNNSAQDWSDKRKRWELEQEIMRILISEGVPIMAGTDCDNPYAFPGFSLHDELALFVQFGMTSLDALRSATIVPVRFLGLADSLGAVSVGKLADVVLLDASPLEDISNTTRINAVIANGKVYDGTYISSALQLAEGKR